MAAIIHIGSDKAGSTALQHALAANRGQLGQQGFDYPMLSDGRPDHFMLATRAARGDSLSGMASPEGAVTLLSSEAFWPLDDIAISRLTAVLDKPLTVIAYVRHPATYVESAFRQRCSMVRSERELRSLLWLARLPAQVNPIAHRAVRRYDQLRRWSAVTAQGQLLLRPYEAGLSARQDIVADFCEVAGVQRELLDIGGGGAPERHNVSTGLLELHASVLLRESADRNTQLEFLRSCSPAAGETLTSRSVRELVQRKACSLLSQIDPGFDELGWKETAQEHRGEVKLDRRAARRLLGQRWS